MFGEQRIDEKPARLGCVREVFGEREQIMSVRDMLVSHHSLNSALHPPVGLESTAPTAGIDRMAEAIRRELAGAGVRGAGPAAVSALSEALTVLDDAQRDPGIMTAVEHPTASLLQSFLAERTAEVGSAEQAPAGGLEAKFDDHDIFGWVGSFFTWWQGIRKHDWLAPPPGPEGFGNSLRVAILGDWGTGLYGAPVCSDSIRKDAKRYGLLLHLGDVYYSGTEKEVAERFLALWPNVPGATSRALNSNHEMYTGGHAYFNQTLHQFGQTSSCFACQNEHWLLVGLDSAYHDQDLAMNQAEWLEGLIAAAGTRKVVLFTHHQPYSLVEKQGAKLVERLSGLLEDRRLFAWYWGHEHRCVVYDVHPTWRVLGRCIGHSGYPYFRTKPAGAELAQEGSNYTWYRLPARNLVPGGFLLDGPNSYVPGQEQRYGPNGYAVLEFEGEHLAEEIRAPDGTPIFRQELA